MIFYFLLDILFFREYIDIKVKPMSESITSFLKVSESRRVVWADNPKVSEWTREGKPSV